MDGAPAPQGADWYKLCTQYVEDRPPSVTVLCRFTCAA